MLSNQYETCNYKFQSTLCTESVNGQFEVTSWITKVRPISFSKPQSNMLLFLLKLTVDKCECISIKIFLAYCVRFIHIKFIFITNIREDNLRLTIDPEDKDGQLLPNWMNQSCRFETMLVSTKGLGCDSINFQTMLFNWVWITRALVPISLASRLGVLRNVYFEYSQQVLEVYVPLGPPCLWTRR